MTDYSRDRLGPDDEDRLPWLEPVDEEPEEGGVGAGRLIGALVAALVVIGLVIGGVFWMRSRSAGTATGDGSMIQAPDSYYKERPANATDASDDDEVVYSASKGNQVSSTIDTSAAAEAPVNVDHPIVAAAAVAPNLVQPAAAKPAAAAPAPAPIATVVAKSLPPAPKSLPPAPKATTSKPAPPVATKTAPKPVAEPEPAPSRASGGTMVQLGAFSSEAKANAAWKMLSARFAFLSGLTQSVAPVQSGDKTLYRLRANGGNAGDICARLRTAGESCSVIG